MFTAGPGLVTSRPGQVLIGDKNYYGAAFQAALAAAGIRLLRPARQGEPEPARERARIRSERQQRWGRPKPKAA
jgi:hypothetical protein